MAKRNTKLVLKNSDIISRPLPSTLLGGEAIVNTAEGIVYFSGVTQSTSGWTSSGPTSPTFFEVGSNLYDLALRNQLIEYEGITGAGLVGKFLSGTTNGFTLADISTIAGAFTSFDAAADTGSAQTITDSDTLTFAGGTGLDSVASATDTITFAIDSTVVTSASTHTLTNKTIDGASSANTLTNLVRVSGDTGTVEVLGGNDLLQILGTGGVTTVTSATGIVTISAGTGNFTGFDVAGDAGTDQTITDANTLTFVGGTGIDTSAQTTDNIVINIDSTVATSANTLDFFSPTTSAELAGIISDETGIGALVFADGPTMSAVTINDSLTLPYLTAGRVPYVGTGGLLTDEAFFTYDTITNILSTPTDGGGVFGTGGVTVGSGGGVGVPGTGDLTVHGNLLVFGDAVSAFTSELYVEDKNITLNYNPTGDTIATSIGAGWTVQDGNGVAAGDVNLEINRLDTLTGLTVTNTPDVTEYVASTGYANRGWITQLNDIIIRSTDITIPNGVRVLAEFDVLDGGSY